jgi:hypothetical protein
MQVVMHDAASIRVRVCGQWQQHSVLLSSHRRSAFRTNINNRGSLPSLSSFNMASPRSEPAALEPHVVFRAGKKRKIYRHRAEEPEPTALSKPTEATAVAIEQDSSRAADARESENNGENEQQDQDVTVSEVLRLRHVRKTRLGGVAFGAEHASLSRNGNANSNENGNQSLVLHDQQPAADVVVAGINQRFAPQTGIVGELVNKHM